MLSTPKRIRAPDPPCLLIQQNTCSIYLYSVPARLITEQVREAFNDGWSPEDVEEYYDDIDPPEVLLPLCGNLTFVGLGGPDIMLKNFYCHVLFTEGHDCFIPVD